MSWARRWVALSARRPGWVVTLCLLLGALSAALAGGLKFRGDFAELLPEDTDEVRDLRFVEQRSGGTGYLAVQVTGGDEAARRRFAAVWAAAVESEKEITRYVEYRFDVGFFRTRALLLMPAEKLAALRTDLAARIDYERTHANPLFVDLLDAPPPPTLKEIEARYAPTPAPGEYLQSKDGSELYLYVKPRGSATDLDFARRMLATVRRLTDGTLRDFPGLEVKFTGSYVIRVEEDDRMKSDLAAASGLSGAIGLGLILLATRRFSALVMVTVPVSVGILFTFALARLTIGHLNPITGFLAAVLVGLGIEYGVHLSMRYREERATLDVLPALEKTVLGTFNGALTSALTNAAAFFVLVFAQFIAFRQFGFLAAVGVMATVLSTYAMGPAVLVLAEKLRPERGARAAPPAPAVGASPRQVPSAAIWTLLVLAVAAAAWSLSVARDVGFETDLLSLRGKSPATALNVHLNEQLGIIMNPALLHVATLDEARSVRRTIDAAKAAGGAGASIDRAASLDDLVPHDVEARLAEVGKLRTLFDDLPESLKAGDSAKKLEKVREMLDVKPWGPEDVPLEIRRRFTALSGDGTLVLIFPKDPCFDTRQLDLWADALSAVIAGAKANGITARVLDGNRVASRIFRVVRGDGPPVMLGAAVVVFLMIWVSLRRLRDAALVAGPLYLGMVCLIGVMHLLGLKLNFFNIVVLPNLLAIAVDNSVHLFHRYHEEGKGSLGRVVRTTGLAAAVATLSNAAGYGALAVAHHAGLRSIAWLALAGVACTFVGTTVLFPGLLALLERRKLPSA